jgi:hypothetical protein
LCVGTPLSVLNRANTYGTVSNVLGDCNASSTGSFNPTTGIMSVSYIVEEYVNNPSCNFTGGNPEFFGYNSFGFSKDMTISIDVRSVVTANAVNDNILNVLNLQVTAKGYFFFDNYNYTTSYYVDPRYPGMKPILCIFLNGTRVPQCLIMVGNIYALPLFNHGGFSFTDPILCNCTQQLELDVETNPYNLCKEATVSLSLHILFVILFFLFFF